MLISKISVLGSSPGRRAKRYGEVQLFKIGRKYDITDFKIFKLDNFCKCGNIIKTKKSKLCNTCRSINNRVVKERPRYDILLKDINELGYVGTGKKYGVSDNSIRKWIKNGEVI